MPKAALLGHQNTKGSPAVEGSPNVSIGGVPVLREGDHFANGDVVVSGAPHVTVNGMPVARLGDPVTNGGTIAQGCSRVTIGNCGGPGFVREMLFQSLTDPKDKLVLCLPEMEAAQVERLSGADKQGWMYAHECITRWMNKEAYVIGSTPNLEAKFDNGKQEPYVVDWDWLMQYQRFSRTVPKLIAPSSLTHPDALANLTRFLQEDGVLAGADRSFDHTVLPLKELRKRAFQSEIMKYIPEIETPTFDNIGNPIPDGLQVAIARTTLFAVAKGEVKNNGETWTVTVKNVGVFIHDAFDFSEDQWLGNWMCSNYKGFYLGNHEGRLENKDLRNFRARRALVAIFGPCAIQNLSR